MPGTPSVAEDVLTSGSTFQFKLQAKKDSVVWNLAGADVTLKVRKPDGSRESLVATIVDAPNGVATFDCDVSELVSGDWQRAWRVVQGGIDVTSLPIAFSVIDSPE